MVASLKQEIKFIVHLVLVLDACRDLSIIFLDYLSRRYFVVSIFCPFDVLSVVVLSVSRLNNLSATLIDVSIEVRNSLESRPY